MCQGLHSLNTLAINSESPIMHLCHTRRRKKRASPWGCLTKSEPRLEFSTSRCLCLQSCLNLCLPGGCLVTLSLSLYLICGSPYGSICCLCVCPCGPVCVSICSICVSISSEYCRNHHMGRNDILYRNL